jgi:hypothetical protein
MDYISHHHMGAGNLNTVKVINFPLLKVQEIIECLAEMNIEVTETELEEPARYKDKLRSVFERLVRKKALMFSLFLFHRESCSVLQSFLLWLPESSPNELTLLRWKNMFLVLDHFTQCCRVYFLFRSSMCYSSKSAVACQ